MLDLALFGFIALVVMIGFRRPYIWVLAYLYVDTVSYTHLTLPTKA